MKRASRCSVVEPSGVITLARVGQVRRVGGVLMNGNGQPLLCACGKAAVNIGFATLRSASGGPVEGYYLLCAPCTQAHVELGGLVVKISEEEEIV